MHFLLTTYFLFLSELCPAAQGCITICTFQGGGIEIFLPTHPAQASRVLPASFWPPTFSHVEGGAPGPVQLPGVGSCRCSVSCCCGEVTGRHEGSLVCRGASNQRESGGSTRANEGHQAAIIYTSNFMHRLQVTEGLFSRDFLDIALKQIQT